MESISDRVKTKKNVFSNNKMPKIYNYLVWQNRIEIIIQIIYENYKICKLAYLSYLNNLEVAIGKNLSLATTNHISLSSTRKYGALLMLHE